MILDRGTTLIELMAALVLLGLLFSGCELLLCAQLGDGNDRVSHAALDADARGNGARTLPDVPLRRGGDPHWDSDAPVRRR